MRSGALLFALAMLAQPVRAEAELLVCRMTGKVLRACCCPPAAPPSGIGARSCCDVVRVATAAPPARVQMASPADERGPRLTGDTPGPAAATTTGVFAWSARVRAVAVVAPPPTAPGPPAVPLFLTLQRLLG